MNELWVLASSTLRLSTPIVIVALGGFYSERAGVVALGLEGLMLIGAFVAASSTSFTHDPYLGMLFAAFASGAVALAYGVLAVRFRADQVVAGAGLNLLAMGVTPFFCKILFEVTGSTPALAMEDRLTWEPHVLAWVMVLTTAWVSRHTRWGLRHRVVGEFPPALEVAGGSVRGMRLGSVFVSGALAGIGGAVLATCLASSFSRGMTAGRGFMALAAVVFGGWRPIPTALACLLFGFFDALQIRLQGVEWSEGFSIPVQWLQVLPYVLTLGVLIGMGSRKKGARPPRSLGLPY